MQMQMLNSSESSREAWSLVSVLDEDSKTPPSARIYNSNLSYEAGAASDEVLPSWMQC